MKYYVAFPISFDCDLHCWYCFHSQHHATNYSGACGDNRDSVPQRHITFTDWDRFRDMHLADAEDILVHFHGGETFLPGNANTIRAFMRHTKKERADLLTNGLQDERSYWTIAEYAPRVNRIGFTFHRRIIEGVPELVLKFERNAMLVKSFGVPVYIKELLFAGTRKTLLAAKARWEALGFEYKIQDFKGTNRGRSFEEWRRYEAEDMLAIDSEYKRGGDCCACMRGYVNVLIRGGWNEGDVLACFEDPVVVGSLQRNEYRKGYRVFKDFQAGRIDVQGVPKVYKGTYERDVYKPAECDTN